MFFPPWKKELKYLQLTPVTTWCVYLFVTQQAALKCYSRGCKFSHNPTTRGNGGTKCGVTPSVPNPGDIRGLEAEIAKTSSLGERNLGILKNVRGKKLFLFTSHRIKFGIPENPIYIPYNYTGVWEKLMELWVPQIITQGPRLWGVWGKAIRNLLWRSAAPAIQGPPLTQALKKAVKISWSLGSILCCGISAPAWGMMSGDEHLHLHTLTNAQLCFGNSHTTTSH